MRKLTWKNEYNHRKDIYSRRHVVKSISEYLSSLSYPGRTILIGNLSDGTQVIAYALMGRSSNSQNRILAFEDGRIRTKLFRKEVAGDTKWTLYDAILFSNGKWVIANGDHSIEIAKALKEGKDLGETIIKLSPEEDTYSTPRISAILDPESSEYSLSIVRKNNDKNEKIIWKYKPFNGFGRIIHTYTGDGSAESFIGDPVTVKLPDFDLFNDIWSSLNPENRISLFVSAGDEKQIANRHRTIERNRLLDRPLERKNWREFGPETSNRKLMNQQRTVSSKLNKIQVGKIEE